MRPSRDPEPVATARRAVYRTLGALFLPPDDERVATLVLAVPELRRLTAPLSELAPFASWSALLDHVETWEDDDVAALRSSYTTMFLSGSRDRSIPPYESAFVAVPMYGQAALSVEVEQHYRDAGLTLSGGFGGELPDHVAAELEFMAYLCGQEALASDETPALRWRDQQLSFLEQHLLRWLPDLSARLRESDPGGTLAIVGQVSSDVAQHDILLLRALSEGAAS